MAGVVAQGLTFTFNSGAILVTNVSVQKQVDLIDGTHLNIAPGSSREWVNGLAADSEVTCDYVAGGLLAAGSSGSLGISGPIAFSGKATVMSSSLSGSVGDLVKGTATFKVVAD